MSMTFNRLDADFYQLSGEDGEQEHIAASGALSVAGLYANHGNETANHGVIGESNNGLNNAAVAYRPNTTTGAPIAADTEFGGVHYSVPHANQQHNSPPLSVPLTEDPVAALLNFPLAGLTASALGQLGTALGSGLGGSGSNGSNGQSGGGTNGTNGTNGNNGTDGSDGGHCATPPTPCEPETPTHCGPGGGHHHGDTNITIIDLDHVVNNVSTVVNNVVHNLVGGDALIDIDIFTNETHNNTHLIDIDLGGVHHHGGNDNNLIDINIGGDHYTAGNDNDVLDLGLGGSSHIGGNDNDIIDLGLGNNNHVAGNDNDVLDLGLGGSSHIGGNDNDLIDLGLGGSGHTTGSDNDLIGIDLNDHSTAGSNNDFLDLDLSLLDDGGLAGVDLGLGNLDLVSVSLNGQHGSDNTVLDLHLDSGDLLGQSHEGLLSDDLNIDLGLNDDLGTALGQGDNGLLDGLGLSSDPSHMAASHGGGTVLGLQLGLGAWV